MSYQTPITIRESIRRIQARELVLPAIQREFVWQPWQIEQLFDSLLRGYPISTFLFWQVKPEMVSKFQWYDFLTFYHERDHRHNHKAVVPMGQGVTAVLDGQQRLTSLYLGLCGSYAHKLPYKQWNNDDAFPKKKLYVNLLATADDLERTYDFRFLTANEANATVLKGGTPCHWFAVSGILAMDNIMGIVTYMRQKGLLDTSKYPAEQGEKAEQILSRLWQAIHSDAVVSYYEERAEMLDKVLQIFIRINSGGTKLSYSDLLLSIATAEWKEGSARELIHGFVDRLNRIGNGFRFDKDFVLKTCLVLADLSDVRFRVDNFSTGNMQIIQERWTQIETSLLAAVELLHEFGYSGETLTATNAVIPIAYYVYFNGYASSIVTAPARQDDRLRIRQWLARVLVKRTFGGQPDSLYGPLRRLIQDSPGSFPLAAIVEHFRGKRKSITFSKEELDSLLSMHYGHPLTLSILTLLYLNRLNGSFRYHVDHMHPKSKFRKSDIEGAGIIDAEEIGKVQARVNLLANLQLLEAGANIGKSDETLANWLGGKGAQRSAYELQHFVPETATADFSQFLPFYEARREMMRRELAQVLGVDLSAEAVEEEEGAEVEMEVE
ncbi:DUF262 domain-containing protein [Hymenobacter saemangeumensis]|uniref:DUF262 domain-containing protein n=1 Tax=Hymenobacter saemangeumensis TaxID=1084522 RepID=A0ABP8IRG8_9BACT